MTAKMSALNSMVIEFDDLKCQVDTSWAGEYEFRPLTEEEKNEFMSSLDARGRQILAELAGEAKSPSDTAEDVVPFCCL